MRLRDICQKELYLILMIGRYKFATIIGAKLEMTNVQGSVKKIFEMSGILRLIPIIEDAKAS